MTNISNTNGPGSRIFTRGFYVYQYATGYSAATAISSKILEEGPKARDNYIEFLKSGSSDYPVELLKIAGVDMASPQPVKMAMETFKDLVDELEKYCNIKTMKKIFIYTNNTEMSRSIEKTFRQKL